MYAGTAARASLLGRASCLRFAPRNSLPLKFHCTHLLWRRASSVAGAESTGLFSLHDLKYSHDFPRMAREAVRDIERTRSYLQSHKHLAPSESLALLDSISADLCGVLDTAELCRNVHQSDDFKQDAEEAFELLSVYMHKLNADDLLVAVLDHVKGTPEYSSLTVEERLFRDNLRHEFESDGIHLTGKLRDLLLQVKEEVGSTETRYSQVVQNKPLADRDALVEVGPFASELEAAHLRSWLTPYVPQTPAAQRPKGAVYVTASKDKRIVTPLLSSIDSESVRQKLWQDSYHYPTENVAHLGQLIKSRQLLARTLGHDSYVHKVLYNKALRTPDEVNDLLTGLSEGSREQALKELGVLRNIKQQTLSGKEGNGAPQSSGSWFSKFDTNLTGPSMQDPGAVTVYPWDLNYLTAAYNNAAASDNPLLQDQLNQRARAQAKIREYLSLDACIDGLKLISRELFGLELEQAPLAALEGWLGSAEDTAQLLKYVVREVRTGTAIGTVYMDLYAREGKFPGSAQFTVQCGCVRTHISPVDKAGGGSLRQETQLPIIALVFNFRPPPTRSDQARHTLLSLQEVETLHHEWGHALHSLLSKTRFQHLAGTRGGTDFIEVPSHWCEYFARTPSVISKWARHHITGESVPPQLLTAALDAAQPFPAISLQNQILYSAVDQFLFGTGIGDVSALSPEQVYHRAARGAAQVQERFTVLPTAPPREGDGGAASADNDYAKSSMNLLDHGHFVNYGGTYYAYLFAKLYAAHIWQAHFAADPLNRDAGEFFNAHLLSHGSSLPPAALLKDLVGGKLDPSHYIRQVVQQ